MAGCSVLVEGVPSPRSACRSTSLCLHLTRRQINDAAQLHTLVAQRCAIPTDRFRLCKDGRIMHQQTSATLHDSKQDERTASDASDEDADSPDDDGAPLVLRFLLLSALVGGKGGFGALLRSSTTKVGAKKTSNFSASRDLSGRRMRHVEAEEAIAKWNSEHHDPVNQTELNAKFKAIKEGRAMEVRVCKWGPTCKYRYSTCRMEHGPDPDAEPAKEKVLSMSQQVPLSSLKAKMTRKEDMQDAVSAGLKSSLKRKARAARGTQGDEEESKEEQDQTDSDEDENDGYESSSGSDSDASPKPPASKRAHTEPAAAAAAASSSSSSAAVAASSSSSYSAYNSAHSASASASSSFHVLAVASYIPSLPASAHAPSELAAIDAKQAQGGIASALAKVKAKQQQAQAANHHSAAAPAAAAAASPSSSSSAAAGAASSSGSYAPIDLSSIARHEDLMQFDAAHLGAELTRVGLKAGGTHEQRAQRLFMMKGSTLEQMPKKIRANS